jgi:hypothetical protein
MSRAHEVLKALLVIVSFCVLAGAERFAESKSPRPEAKSAGGLPAVLWRDPGDIASRNLLYGPGSKEREPIGRFKFLKEETGGASPKFDVEDERGVRWRVKLGPEANAETAATRLLWSVGYFADEDYYVPELRVEGMQKLSRGQKFVSAEGIVRGAGLERHAAGRKKIGTWSWSDNPFVGTKELGGLKLMMALMNNWDLKNLNNTIYNARGLEYHYVVSDVGATLGRSGNTFRRTKDNLKHYSQSKFVRETTPEEVDFFLASRPHPLNSVILPHLLELRKREKVVKNILRADARWIDQLLSQLSPEQIGDCFRASGHSPEEVEGYTKAVQERIRALNQL